MAIIHLQRIRNAITKLFEGHIDLSDYDGRGADEREKAFLTRALSAYTLTLLAEVEPAVAAAHITDGFDDGGIDAIYFDDVARTLFVVQSKWISDGNGSIDQAGAKKFFDGFRDLMHLRFDRFNNRLRAHEATIKSALFDSNARFVLAITHSGAQSGSQHVQREVDDLLAEMNDADDVVAVEWYGQQRLYAAVAGQVQGKAIDTDLILTEWGYVKSPYPAYYGQVSAGAMAALWKQHGRDLFTRNIRNFKGSTDVNDALIDTLRREPQHLWYFNNGITVLCSRVGKKPVGGASHDTGVFELEGLSVVNGAQTVGVIGSYSEAHGDLPDDAKVLVRLISLEHCPEGFDKEVTRATNTQNRIERRDFAALDPNQHRLASELQLDGKRYVFKTGEDEPAPEQGCSITEATVALACASGELTLAVQAKREIGRLWENIDRAPYTTLFNDQTSATNLWRVVEIARLVDKGLQIYATGPHPRAAMIAVHGNRFILYRVFLDPRIRSLRPDPLTPVALAPTVLQVTGEVFDKVAGLVGQLYPDAYLAILFKNPQKCATLAAKLDDPNADIPSLFAQLGQSQHEGDESDR
jgi:hypothetical protein